MYSLIFEGLHVTRWCPNVLIIELEKKTDSLGHVDIIEVMEPKVWASFDICYPISLILWRVQVGGRNHERSEYH